MAGTETRDQAFPVADHSDTPGSTKHRGRPCGCWHTGLKGSCVPCCLEAGWGRAHRRKGSSTPALGGAALQLAPGVPWGMRPPVALRIAVIMLHFQQLGVSHLSSLPHWSLLPNKLPELGPLLRSTAGGFGTKTSISVPGMKCPPPPPPAHHDSCGHNLARRPTQSGGSTQTCHEPARG